MVLDAGETSSSLACGAVEELDGSPNRKHRGHDLVVPTSFISLQLQCMCYHATRGHKQNKLTSRDKTKLTAGADHT